MVGIIEARLQGRAESIVETLQEYASSAGLKLPVDREHGILRGVKILGLESRNGRTYRPEALAGAVSLYEGAKVNVNHVRKGDTRDYQSRIGVVRNVTPRAGGLYADFHFNPKHAMAEQLCWDAEHAPGNVGFSHDVEARTSHKNGRVIVEAITRVSSVDLVADPATTSGLFESGDAVVEQAGGQRSTREAIEAAPCLTVESLVPPLARE